MDCAEEVEERMEGGIWTGSPAKKLAQAVLLFYKGSFWTPKDSQDWFNLTQTTECTTKNLCDYARQIIADEEKAEKAEKAEKERQSDVGRVQEAS